MGYRKKLISASQRPAKFQTLFYKVKWFWYKLSHMRETFILQIFIYIYSQ